LQWAREHDCPWDNMTCELAAAFRHWKTLRWAREQGCPWDVETCDAPRRMDT
jgi:hypothetical protein